MGRGAFFPDIPVCHMLFIEAEYACRWELLLKEKNSKSLTKTYICQWLRVELQGMLAL